MATVFYEYFPMVLEMGPKWKAMSDDEFFEFCQHNHDLRIERTANGDLAIMPPAGADSSEGNAHLVRLIGNWNEIRDLGKVYDSSAGFKFRTGAVRSPDASWVLRDRVEQFPKEQRRKYLPLAPDFVVELRSPSDSLVALHNKMREYIDAGVRLGWLIDPDSKTLWIYQPGSEPTQLDNPESVSGDPVLPGFVLKLATIWGE